MVECALWEREVRRFEPAHPDRGDVAAILPSG